MIELNEGIALRDAAAAAARARLAADMSRADAALRPALRYLQSHLFDPQLEAAEVARRGKLRGGRGSTRWRAVTGMTVGDYVRMLRVHTAAALLVDTPMANERIAELVGYQEITTFYRAFRRVLGTTPAAYRTRQRGAAAQDNTEGLAPGRLAFGRLALATEAPEWLTAFDAWSRAEAASRDRASCDRASGDQGLPDSEVLAESATGRASLAWGVARGLSPRGREHLVAHVGTTTPALAELLFARSRVEGRGDRDWGIEVAKLALRAVPRHTNSLWTAKAITGARVRAHAWIGNAHRLALDFTAAEAAFARARARAEEGREEIGDRVRGELALTQAALHWFLSDFDPALAFADNSVELARGINDVEKLVAALRLRAAIHGSLGQPRASIRDLQEALALLDPQAAPAEVGWLQIALMNRAIELRDLASAERHWARAEHTIRTVASALQRAHLRSIAGRLAWARRDLEQAEILLQQAAESFEALDARFQIVAVRTDLCLVQLERGRDPEALAQARLLLPALRFMRADREWQELLRALRQAIQQQAVGLALMRQVKAHLRHMVAERYDP